MPCYEAANIAEKKVMNDELKQLEQDIATGKVIVTRNYRGELSVSGWSTSGAAKASWCEGCALAEMATSGSWLVRSKLAALGLQKGKEFVAATHNSHNHKVGGQHSH